jgi:hypothetical protein
MQKELFFPLFLLIAITFTLVYIPRRDYRKYVIYAAITGGLGNMLITLVVFRWLKVARYVHIGIFDIEGFNYLEPFAWTFVQMLFLYFLPVRKWFLYGYVLGFTGISIGFGYVIRNLGISETLNPAFSRYLSPVIFLAWWSFTAWFYRRIEGINRQKENPA